MRVSTLVKATISLSVRPRSVKSRGDTGASPQRGQKGVVTTALQVGQVQGWMPVTRATGY